MSITVVILIMLGVGALLLTRKVSAMPTVMAVKRSTTIQAPPEAIFPLIQDFHRWTVWSPYEELDPKLKRLYGGAPFGTGAIYEWSGNNKVGAGRMEITDTAAPSRLAIKLDFIRPFEGHNTAEFSLRPDGAATVVTWAMRGPNPPMARMMGMFIDMDQMIGKDFEKGLAKLKAEMEG